MAFDDEESMSVTRAIVVGGGGVGAIVALNLTAGQQAEVTLSLRSNYSAVKDKGFTIDSVDHGHLEAWRPHKGKYALSPVDGHC